MKKISRSCSKAVSSLVAENKNTSLFIIIPSCFPVRVSNPRQLAFRVRRDATTLRQNFMHRRYHIKENLGVSDTDSVHKRIPSFYL